MAMPRHAPLRLGYEQRLSVHQHANEQAWPCQHLGSPSLALAAASPAHARARVCTPAAHVHTRTHTACDFRSYLQAAVSTWVLMIIYSPSPVWSAMSLDPVVFTPALSLMLLVMMSMSWIQMGLSQLELGVQLMMGCAIGSSAGLTVVAIVRACNGGTMLPTTAKVSRVGRRHRRHC